MSLRGFLTDFGQSICNCNARRDFPSPFKSDEVDKLAALISLLRVGDEHGVDGVNGCC